MKSMTPTLRDVLFFLGPLTIGAAAGLGLLAAAYYLLMGMGLTAMQAFCATLLIMLLWLFVV